MQRGTKAYMQSGVDAKKLLCRPAEQLEQWRGKHQQTDCESLRDPETEDVYRVIERAQSGLWHQIIEGRRKRKMTTLFSTILNTVKWTDLNNKNKNTVEAQLFLEMQKERLQQLKYISNRAVYWLQFLFMITLSIVNLQKYHIFNFVCFIL